MDTWVPDVFRRIDAASNDGCFANVTTVQAHNTNTLRSAARMFTLLRRWTRNSKEVVRRLAPIHDPMLRHDVRVGEQN